VRLLLRLSGWAGGWTVGRGGRRERRRNRAQRDADRWADCRRSREGCSARPGSPVRRSRCPAGELRGEREMEVRTRFARCRDGDRELGAPRPYMCGWWRELARSASAVERARQGHSLGPRAGDRRRAVKATTCRSSSSFRARDTDRMMRVTREPATSSSPPLELGKPLLQRVERVLLPRRRCRRRRGRHRCSRRDRARSGRWQVGAHDGRVLGLCRVDGRRDGEVRVEGRDGGGLCRRRRRHGGEAVRRRGCLRCGLCGRIL